VPQEIVVDAQRLKHAIEAIVVKGGSSPREAELVAGNLIEANLTGHDSHGVGMIPRYIDAVLEGGLAVNAHPEIKLDTGVMLRLDGRSGYGQVIGMESMALGIERAREHGTCIVALGNSHHLGRIGHWAEQCVGAGLVSLHFVNVVSRPIVAPWGGRDPRFGTNPVCIGVPRAGKPPFLLDFATSRIAQGKTRVAHNQGKPLAPGTIIDDNGDPTTNPRYTVIPPYGAILPFGEHKGYGLAVAAELLGGALAAGATQSFADEGKRRVLNGMLSILIEPKRLGAEGFADQSEAFIEWCLASPAAAGVDRVKLAGDPERENRKKRTAEGIAVDATTWEEILVSADKLKLPRAEVQKLAGL
jgi:hydroxycarboxylate dehydrogenase B